MSCLFFYQCNIKFIIFQKNLTYYIQDEMNFYHNNTFGGLNIWVVHRLDFLWKIWYCIGRCRELLVFIFTNYAFLFLYYIYKLFQIYPDEELFLTAPFILHFFLPFLKIFPFSQNQSDILKKKQEII